MDTKKFNLFRSLVVFFEGMVVAIAVIQNSYLLAVAGILTAMLFMIMIRSKTKRTIDEREKAVREKAAQFTYAIFAPLMGLNALILTMLGRNNPTLMSAGQTLSYLTLLLIIIYAISYKLVNRKLGGGSDDEEQN